MPSVEDTNCRHSRGKLMLMLVVKAVRSLRDCRGSTLNDVVRFLEHTFEDDKVVKDTHTLIPRIWHALNIGIGSGQLILSKNGHRFKLGHEFDFDIAHVDERPDCGKEGEDDGEGKTNSRFWKEREREDNKERNNNKSEARHSHPSQEKVLERRKDTSERTSFQKREDCCRRMTRSRTKMTRREQSRSSKDRRTKAQRGRQRTRKTANPCGGGEREKAGQRGREAKKSLHECQLLADEEEDEEAGMTFCEPLLIPHVDVFS